MNNAVIEGRKKNMNEKEILNEIGLRDCNYGKRLHANEVIHASHKRLVCMYVSFSRLHRIRMNF
jgi:hypothetical protein